MSQPRDPTSAGDPNPDEHPDELLAAYVDGSASPDEAVQAEAHLATCAGCRGDVELARGALGALKALPVLDSPWAGGGSPAIAATAAAAEPVVVRSLDEHRNRRRNRVLTAGLAAAASLLIGVLVIAHLGGSGASSTAALPGAAAGTAPDISKGQINDIASQLAGGGSPRLSAPASGTTTAGPKQGAAPVSTFGAEGAAGVPCARRASGQPAGASVVYAQAATFEGKSVWVVGFLSTSGGSSAVEVVAVTTKGCSIAYIAWQPVGSTP